MQSIVAIPPTERTTAAPRLILVARGAAGVVVAVAAAVLLGWWFGLDRVTRVMPGYVTMKPNTALALGLLAISWLAPARLARVAAALAGAIAVTTLAEYVFGVEQGVDSWLFRLHGSSDHPGRMAITTACALLAIAIGRLIPLTTRTHRRVVELLGLAVVGTAVLAVLGYLFDVRSLYSTGPLSTMAVHTAVALLLLGGATLMVVPAGFVDWLVDGSDAGAVLMRRVLPVTLVLIPAIGYLRLLGERAGLYGTGFGLAITTVASMAVLVATTGYTARRLRRSDENREAALTALQTVNQDLELRVSERASQLATERGLSALLRDRERIAADVHDLVIQRLYAVGLGLQAEAGRALDPSLVETAVDGIDDAMRELRGTIFELRQQSVGNQLTTTLDEIVAGAAAILPNEPTVSVQGDPTVLPEPVVVHLLAVLREAVSNAVRHARPDTLSIDVDVTAADVTLRVTDDGVGIDPAVVSTSGLRNLAARAEHLHGTCEWRPVDPHGTSVVWQVPWPRALAPAPRPTRNAQLMKAMQQIARAATTDRSDPLTATATALCELIDADCIALVVDEDDEHLRIVRTRGFPADLDPRGRRVPRAGSLAEHVLAGGEALRVGDIRVNSSSGTADTLVLFGPALVLPLRGAACVHGAVSVARFAGRAPFTAADEELAMTLATHTALALDLGHAHLLNRPLLAVDA